MNCDKALLNMSLYLDNELDKASIEEFLAHIRQCEKCRNELEKMQELIKCLDEMDFVELPEGYHNELMEKIQNTKIEPLFENKTQKVPSKNKKTIWKKYSVFAAAFAIFVIVGGTFGGLYLNNPKSSGMASESAQMPANMDSDAAPKEALFMGEGAAEESYDMKSQEKNTQIAEDGIQSADFQGQTEERKKIKTLNADIRVYDFDDTVKQLQWAVENSGGYVESFHNIIYYSDDSRNIRLKDGYMTLKMPSQNYESIKTLLENLGIVDSINETTEDVTAQYIDTESKLKMLRIEEQRLLDLLQKSGTIEEILKIEERLSIVRQSIESATSAIQNWDRLVKYSTVHVSIMQIEKDKFVEVASDFGQKVKSSFIQSVNGFIQFCQMFVIMLAGAFIPIAVIGVVIGIAVFFIKYFIKRSKKNDV